MRLNDIKRTLGEPYFQRGNVILYQADGLRAMQELPHEIFDATITSPPNHIDDTGERGIPLSDYISWSSRWMQEVYHLTKATGSFWVGLGCTSVKEVGGQVPLPYLLWDRSDFYMMKEFSRNRPSSSPRGHPSLSSMDKLLWLVKDSQHYHLDRRQMNRLVSDSSYTNQSVAPHHGEMTYSLAKNILRATTRPGDIILDPFTSSSMISQASKDLGRKIVGFSLDTDVLNRVSRQLKREG